MLFLLLVVGLPTAFAGRPSDYRFFENISLGAESSVVGCVVQDTQGLIWIGSNNGLYSYDGYSMQPHFVFGQRNNTHIYCGTVADSTYLYLGADNGLLIYNYRTDTYEEPPVEFPTDIRSLALRDGVLWLGTLNGLYAYHLSEHRLDNLSKGLPHQAVYALIAASDGALYIGTYNGCCRYLPAGCRFEAIGLPVPNSGRSNLFVNSLLEDKVRGCIWIGTEGCLFRYTPADGRVQRIDAFHDNSVKSLALDGSGQLLVGTDNGLYVYQEDKPLQHIVHDSRSLQSLSNNIIWTIFTDREQNSWLGTDYGISMARHGSLLRYIPISQITGGGEGNRFYTLLRDSHGTHWFGGTNGLLRFDGTVDKSENIAWYKMGDKRFPLPHNRVRQFYEDREQRLWVATDGSISRYEPKSGQFVRYNIVDSTRRYNANWAYSLFEDGEGRLWVATCLGGIFVVDKQKLLRSAGGTYVAEKTYSIHNGLSGMFINQMTPDHEGNVWVLLYNSAHSIEKINPRTGSVTPMASGELKGERAPNYMLCDEDGFIWVGFPGGVMRITPQDNRISILPFDAYNRDEVLSMIEADGKIWISTTNGFWIADRHLLKLRRLNITDKRFTSLYFDKRAGMFYLGATDGFAVSSPELLLADRPEQPLVLTALYVNNRLHIPGTEQPRESIRYARRIVLKHHQNNLAFELSNLPYAQEEKSKLVYRLEGVDREWNLLNPHSNRITYNNLKYGDYRLVVSKLNAYGIPAAQAYTLDIQVIPPWYYTLWAKVAYLLLCLVLIAWTVNFFRVKNRLKQEKQQLKQVMHSRELHEAKARMEILSVPKEIEAVSYDEKFLANVTHAIEEHLSDSELNVNALCERTATNNKQMYRKIKQLTGMTPVEYIKSIRMKKAAMLLKQKKFTVAEVMYMVGFSNHSYFSKCFQAEFGRTPKQYREEGDEIRNLNYEAK